MVISNNQQLTSNIKSASIGIINITHSQDTQNAVSLQLIMLGTRHCRVRPTIRSATRIDMTGLSSRTQLITQNFGRQALSSKESAKNQCVINSVQLLMM